MRYWQGNEIIHAIKKSLIMLTVLSFVLLADAGCHREKTTDGQPSKNLISIAWGETLAEISDPATP